jgi:hypothetical protein
MLDTYTSIYKPLLNKRYNLESFILKANLVHNRKYTYENAVYKNCTTKVEITCPIHGSFLQRPKDHLNKKQGCIHCQYVKQSNTLRSSKEEFIEKAIKIHDLKYDYSKIEYTTAKKKIEIICPTHGSFFQKPYSHLEGRGCKECVYERSSSLYSEKWYKNHPTLNVYLLRCFNSDEEFLKIGLTSRTIEKRYKTIFLMPYSYETLFIKELDAILVVELEAYIKNNFTHHWPKQKFAGFSECLLMKEKDEIVLHLNRTIL